MSETYDVCVIGSGAGGGPVALTLAQAGFTVVVLEKGPWWTSKDFTKDELGEVRRPHFEPSKRDEPHVFEEGPPDKRHAYLTKWGWNANCVGGASVVMSGFFFRMKPDDFRLKTVYGPVEGASVADWPITYDDLEPYYAKTEREVGISGRAGDHPLADRRSSPFPFPPLDEHPFAGLVDRTCRKMGLHPYAHARAVLPRDWPEREREACSYTRYCSAFGCATNAKGSSLAALLPRAVKTGRCRVVPNAMVRSIVSDDSGRAVAAEYFDEGRSVRRVEARVFVVACNAIETARLLLLSRGPRHPNGLANDADLVGRNVLFSTFGAVNADFDVARHRAEHAWMGSVDQPFVHRALDDYQFIDDPRLGRRKGGTLGFLLPHGNPIAASIEVAFWDPSTVPLWGEPLKKALVRHFRETAHLECEVFGDYTPMHDGRVILDPPNSGTRDKWGLPSARVQIVRHPRDLETARFLADRGAEVLREMKADDVRIAVGGQSTNLIGGTCRFGTDPATSVLDPDCRAWSVDNLYVTDGSFMPTGGSIPFTWTIYANSFRVADRIVERLKAKG